MTEEYRQNGLKEAQENFQTARDAWLGAKTSRQRRAAAFDLEFWGNKLAFFACTKPEAMLTGN